MEEDCFWKLSSSSKNRWRKDPDLQISVLNEEELSWEEAYCLSPPPLGSFFNWIVNVGNVGFACQLPVSFEINAAVLTCNRWIRSKQKSVPSQGFKVVLKRNTEEVSARKNVGSLWLSRISIQIHSIWVMHWNRGQWRSNLMRWLSYKSLRSVRNRKQSNSSH